MSDALTVVVDRSTLRIEAGAIPVDTVGGSVGPDLEAIEALTGTGVLARTGISTWTLDAGLDSLRAVDTGADLLPYTTGANAWAGATLTSYARTLLDDANAATARATLGIAETVIAVCTPGTTTSDQLTGVTTGAALTLSVGTWILDGSLYVSSATTSIGVHFAFFGDGTIVAPDCAISHVTPTSAVLGFISASTGLNTWSPATSGPGAVGRASMLSGIVEVTTAGTMTLWLKTELANNAVTLLRGVVRATKVA